MISLAKVRGKIPTNRFHVQLSRRKLKKKIQLKNKNRPRIEPQNPGFLSDTFKTKTVLELFLFFN
jgi:hypothetical protein